MYPSQYNHLPPETGQPPVPELVMPASPRRWESLRRKLSPPFSFHLPNRLSPRIYFLIFFITLIALIAPIVLITLRHPAYSKASWYNTNWPYRVRITIDHTKVGADLTNYPALINFTLASIGTYAQSTGNDILFADAQGYKLDHEIEQYTSATGAVIAWVRIPNLSSTVDTDIYLYYGNPTAASQQNVTGVWRDNYVGVWHMKETSSTYADSVNAAQTGTLTDANTNSTRGAAAAVGAGLTLNGDADYVSVTDTAPLSPTAKMSIELWANQASLATNKALMAKWTYQSDGSWTLQTDNVDNTRLRMFVAATANEAGNNFGQTPAGSWSTGQHYVAYTYDGSGSTNANKLKAYIDSVNKTVTFSGTIPAAILDSAAPIRFGDYQNLSRFFNGTIDEIRISNVVRSQAYLTTVYNNINSPSTFISTTTESLPRTPIAYWRFDEGVDNTCSGGTNDACNAMGDATLDGTGTSLVWKPDDFCISGKCLGFDGSAGYVSITNNAAINFDANVAGYTVSFWLKTNNTTNSRYYLVKQTNSGHSYPFKFESGATGANKKVAFAAYDLTNTPTVTSNKVIADNTWHQITGVYSKTDNKLYLYIDGAYDNEVASTITATTAGGDDIRMMRDSGTNYTAGFLDEVKLYNYERTATEIYNDYQTISTVKNLAAQFGTVDPNFFNKGLVGYWKMDESAANSCGTDDSCDSTGNSYNGAWTNNVNTTTIAKYGNATTLDGTDDYIQVSGLMGSPAAVTIGGWVNLTAIDSGGSDFISLGDAVTIRLEPSAGVTQGLYHPGSWTITQASVSVLNKGWKQVYYVVNPAKSFQGLYIDGDLVAQSSDSTAISYSGVGANTIFGRHGNANTSYDFTGQMDDLRVFNRALSDQEIKALYIFSAPPVAYWKFDQNQGQTVFDLSGNGLNGTLGANSSVATDDPVYAPGKFGSGIKLDGANDFVAVLTNTLFDLNSFTMESWIYLNSYSALTDFISRRTGEKCFSLSTETSGYVSVRLGNTTCETHSGTAIVPLNSWHHIAATYDANTDIITFYLDGNFSGTATDSDSPVSMGSVAVGVGSYTGGGSDWVNGMMDDTRIYNYVRTSQQIVSDMNGDHPAGGSPISSQTLYWTFDEGKGTTAYNKGTGANLNGTISNFTPPSTPDSGWVTGKINQAFSFDGTGDVVTVTSANAAAVNFYNTAAFSGSAWVYPRGTMPTSAQNAPIIAKWDESNAQRVYRLVLTNDDSDTTSNFKVELRDQSAAQSISASSPNDSVSLSNWYHVAFTYNGGIAGAAGDLKLYVTSSNPSTPSLSSNSANASFLGTENLASDFTVGDYDPNDSVAGNIPFLGMIDEVQMYNSTLTADQVKIIANTNAATNISTANPASAFLNGQVGYWAMNEATWTGNCSSFVVMDSSGFGDGGKACPNGSATTPVVGKYGNAASLNGSTQYINLGNPTILQAFSALTISAWINATALATNDYNMIFYKDSSSYYLSMYNKKLRFRSDNLSTTIISGATTLSTATWYHVAVTYDGAKVTLYLNGMIDGSAAATGAITDNGINASIGAFSTNSLFFNGKIDDVRVFNRALSQTEIFQLSNWYSPPVVWLKMDENTGTTTTYDSSGNGYDATLAGMKSSDWVPAHFGSGLNFDAVAKYMTVAQNTNINNIKAMTIEAWIYPRSQGGSDVGRIADKNNNTFDTGSWGFMLGDTTTNGLSFYRNHSIQELKVESSDNTIQLNRWQHVALTWNGGKTAATDVHMYVNGIETGYQTQTDANGNLPADEGNEMYVGAFNSDLSYGGFDGYLDDFRIYNYALTSAQVAIDYNGGKPAGWYKFDDCSGSSVKDASGNGYTGTVTVTGQTLGTCSTGSTAWGTATGKFGNSIYLDGTGDFVNLTDPSSGTYDLGKHDLSASLWYKGASGVFLLAKAYNNPSWSLSLQGDGTVLGRITTVGAVNYDVASTTSVNNNAWHMVTIVFNRSGTEDIYIDGKFEKSTSISALSATDLSNTNSLSVGGNCDAGCASTGNYATGQFDDVRLYPFALSPLQVQTIYAEGSSVRFGPP
jgi:hypothetical protein